MSMESTRCAYVLASILALTVVLGAFVPVAASEPVSTTDVPLSVEEGSGTADATISIDDGTGTAGETVTVAVQIDGDSIAGYQANLSWDPSVLELASIQGVDFGDPVTNEHDGWVFMTQSQADGQDSPTVVRLTFTVVGDGGDATELAFAPADTSANDADGSQLDTAIENGRVTVNGDDVSADATSASDGDATGTTGATASGTSSTDGDVAAGTTAGTQANDGGDGGDGGTLPSPVLLAGVVVGVVAVLGTGYVLGQRNG